MKRGKLGRQCSFPRCGEIIETRGESYCQAHKKQRSKEMGKWSGDNTPDSFYTDKKWRRLSAHKRAVAPLCEKCKRAPSQEVHHKIPRRERPDLAYEWENLEALCKRCHAKETRREIGDRR